MPPNTSIQRYIKKNIISKPFNLLKGPLMKFYLIHDNQSKNLSYLIISAHHFIVDGTGAVVLGREISNAYN
ncbi:condensation domain-containing protein, partial [Coxiella burnetii]